MPENQEYQLPECLHIARYEATSLWVVAALRHFYEKGGVMLHRKIFIVLLLALALGCTMGSENEEQEKARKVELTKVYKEQLIKYNSDIEEVEKKLGLMKKEWDAHYKSYSIAMKSLKEFPAKKDFILETYDADIQIIDRLKPEMLKEENKKKKLVEKRDALKLQVLELSGSLPTWWVER